MMKITDIITTIFEYKHFDTIIISVSIFLVLLFIIVLILGLLDAHKKKEKPVELFEKEEEITFEAPKEELIINEEITLEMPSITKNLEDFKKSIEEEIKQENITSNIEVEQSNEKPLLDNSKPIKILNINEIENTQIVETIKEEQESIIEEYVEEIEILDESFDEPMVAELQEDAIIEVQKLNIPLLESDEDDEMLFKTMTALRIPQDV